MQIRAVAESDMSQAIDLSNPDEVPYNKSLEFLAFTLGGEEYGIDILEVQEIRGYENVTRIANAADSLKGIVNLHGINIPIVDMRIKFKLGDPAYDQFTVVIIININDQITGVVVDSVSDVVTLSEKQIKQPPNFGPALDVSYIIGMVTIENRLLILLDIERLVINH